MGETHWDNRIWTSRLLTWLEFWQQGEIMRTLDRLKQNLKPGQVYRRAELAKFSSSVDRNLRELLDSGMLKKLWFGVYYYPRKCRFGELPAEEQKVISAFLEDEDFLMMSLNYYNGLGVGTTQLYNERIVYNHKHSGHKNLARRKYFFVKNRKYPKKLSKEFLLVDLINNLDLLEEDQDEILRNVEKKAKILGVDKMCRLANRYGLASTREFFNRISDGGELGNAV